MSGILEIAFKKAKVLSSLRQDEVGRMLLDLIEQDSSKLSLTADQVDEVRRRMSRPLELVPVEEMNGFFNKLAR